MVLPRRRNVDVTLNATMYQHDTLGNTFCKHTNNKKSKWLKKEINVTIYFFLRGCPYMNIMIFIYYQNESSNITIITNKEL